MQFTRYFDTKRKIEMLRKLSMRNASPEDFIPLLQNLLFHQFEIRGFIPDDGDYIYRARKNEVGKLFAHADELKHPKISNEKGRMNDVGESFFYGARCELGTIYEMAPALGSLFTISRVIKRRGTPIFYLAGLLDDPRSPSPRNSTEKIIYDYLHGELTKVTKTADDYNSTIAISRLLLSKDLLAPDEITFCGLVYPSVQLARGVANVRTFNFGMKGNVFDDNFRIKDAFVYCLTDEGTRYQLNEVNRGEVIGEGDVNWQFTYVEMQRRMSSGLAADGTIVESLKKHADNL